MGIEGEKVAKRSKLDFPTSAEILAMLSVIFVVQGLLSIPILKSENGFIYNHRKPLMFIVQFMVYIFAIRFALNMRKFKNKMQYGINIFKPFFIRFYDLPAALIAQFSLSLLLYYVEPLLTFGHQDNPMVVSMVYKFGALNAVFGAALFEETLFRGIILRGFLSRHSPFKAIVFSATFFAIYHLNIYQLLPTLVLGIVYGYIFYKTRSLIICIICHLINNGIAVYDLYFGLKLPPFISMTGLSLSFAASILMIIIVLAFNNKKEEPKGPSFLVNL